MEETHHDQSAFYKELEKQCNNIIHTHTNCRSFTFAFGKAMEAHLKEVRIHKTLTNKWLTQLNLPNKDEIATLSVKIVEWLDKLDLLDESIYTMNKRQHHNQIQLQMITESLKELVTLLENEVQELKINKINVLEKELLELKQLFY